MDTSKYLRDCWSKLPQELDQYFTDLHVVPSELPLSEYCSYTQNGNRNDHIKKCEILLKHGADVNQRHGNGRTCLMNACMFVFDTTIALCELLLKHGALINETSPYDGTALNIVSRSSSKHAPQVVQYLLQHGADPDLSSGGDFPLHSAIIFQSPYRIEICQHLLRNGADPNQQDEKGNTCLHSSGYQTATATMDADTSRTTLRTLLLDYGANPLIRDGYGRPPYGLESLLQQRQQQYDDLKRLLLTEQTNSTSTLYQVHDYVIDLIVNYTYKLP